MNEIIKINYDTETPTISGRDLHHNLEIGTEYSKWFERMIEYGFTEGLDFSSFLTESTGGRPATDHALTIPMAKEIAMLQRNEKGKQIRQYLIKLEEAWNTPEAVMSRALKMADTTIRNLQTDKAMLSAQIEAEKPLVMFAKSVDVSNEAILISELAKLLKQNGVNIGQNRLYERLRNDGYLIRRKGMDWNSPTQKAMNMGLFKIKETVIARSNGRTSISRTTKVVGKGQLYFINKFLKEKTEVHS